MRKSRRLTTLSPMEMTEPCERSEAHTETCQREKAVKQYRRLAALLPLFCIATHVFGEDSPEPCRMGCGMMTFDTVS